MKLLKKRAVKLLNNYGVQSGNSLHFSIAESVHDIPVITAKKELTKMSKEKRVNQSGKNCDTNDNNSVNNETADRKEDSISVFHEFVRKVETVYDADVYFYNGDIQFDSFGILASLISKTKQSTQKENALLIMITLGGDGEAAFRIAKLFQKAYKSFKVYVPTLC